MASEVLKKEESLNLKITGKSHVKPNKKIGRKECQLVTFDLPYLAFYYNQKLLFYKGDDFEGMVKKLKDGLGVVLEEFHQLAGKIGKDEEGVFRVEYDDDMPGVEVTEAVADEVAVADLTVAESNSTLKELVPYNGILNLEGMHRPLLVVQVILFAQILFVSMFVDLSYSLYFKYWCHGLRFNFHTNFFHLHLV